MKTKQMTADPGIPNQLVNVEKLEDIQSICPTVRIISWANSPSDLRHIASMAPGFCIASKILIPIGDKHSRNPNSSRSNQTMKALPRVPWERVRRGSLLPAAALVGCLYLFLLLSSLSVHAQQAQEQSDQVISTPVSDSDPVVKVIAATPYAIATRDGNQKVWSKVTWESNAITGKLSIRTNSYTELATGSAHLLNGTWVDSSDQITITKTGAEATNSQHQVRFFGNINTSNAITLTLPEGDKYLASTPIGLSYFDYASGKSVLIAELKDSVGQLLPPGNQVLYPEAFTDISADLLYINSVSGFEQLVVLREQLPSPAEWGLDPETTLLQVITEFINPRSHKSRNAKFPGVWINISTSASRKCQEATPSLWPLKQTQL